MNKRIKVLTLFLIIYCSSFTLWRLFGIKGLAIDLMSCMKIPNKAVLPPANITTTLEAPKESGIFFLETTDRMIPPALVVCSIESAARTYQERPVYFLMKGLTKNGPIHLNSDNPVLFLLALLRNVHILPLSFEELFKDTPIQPWYQKVDPKKQRHWIHHISDACRQVVLWKYGGIYMDTDLISLRPVPWENFLTAQNSIVCGSAVLGFSKHHPFLWDCMKDYVESYNGNVWGQQGPLLYTRMAAKLCKMSKLDKMGDRVCQNFSYVQQKHFYPHTWNAYYSKWEKSKSQFNESYGFHFFNKMNTEHLEVTAGSNTLAEHIFMDYCPLTYLSLVKKKPS